jgi:hypothetical protein
MKCQNKVSKSVRILRIPFSFVSISSNISVLVDLLNKITECTNAISKNNIATDTCSACINVITKKYGPAGFGLKER